MSSLNAYHWVLFHHPSHREPSLIEGRAPQICCRLYGFSPGCFCTSAGPRARSGFVSSMMVVVIVNTLSPSLICNLHATVHRLCINDHGRVVLVHGGRQLTLGLGETLADGEHAVDDDGVYALLYLALRFEFG